MREDVIALALAGAWRAPPQFPTRCVTAAAQQFRTIAQQSRRGARDDEGDSRSPGKVHVPLPGPERHRTRPLSPAPPSIEISLRIIARPEDHGGLARWENSRRAAINKTMRNIMQQHVK